MTLSLDTESTGLSEKDRPFALIVSDGVNTDYLDERVHSREQIARQIDALMGCRTLIAQNAKFDLRMLQHWGFDLAKYGGKVADTAVLGRLVRNDHMSYSLADAGARIGFPKSDEVKKYIGKHHLYTFRNSQYKSKRAKDMHFDRVPIDIMERYAKNDAYVTFKLYEKLLPQLDPRSVDVWEMECALTPVLFDMERAGIRVNVPYVERAIEHEMGLIREAKSQFLLATGREYDNSKTMLVEVFSAAGETIRKTSKGNDSLTDDDLERFTSPAAQLVQRIRHHEKRVGTYYSSFIELRDSDDILHADIWQSGTTTGRLSYRDPNLQNCPKEEDSVEPFVVRGSFMPREGNIFVSIDYKQQEYRLMLAYAKHRRLIEEVMAGKDVHQATADLVRISRHQAKTLNFAILYGAGPDKISQMLGISIYEARILREKYFNSLMEVEQLIFNIVKRGQGCGFVFNWFGRKLHINHRDFAYKLPNYVMQGGGADICKLAMVSCSRLLGGTDIKMVLQVHDALIFEGPKEQFKKILPDITKAMNDVFPEKAGMRMDVDVTWSAESLAERQMAPWEA